MEKYAWKASVKQGSINEYKERHDKIWQEMQEVLKTAGIGNYSIWTDGNMLFGYYECEKGIEYALKVQKESVVAAKWNDYMNDILIMEMEPTGGQPKLMQVFDFNSDKH